MLSRKRMRQLIRSTYGANNQFTKQLADMYDTANRQIKGEISRFMQSSANWSGKPAPRDLNEAKAELQRLQAEQSTAPLVATIAAGLTLGHPKNSDVERARIAAPLIRVAQRQNQQLQRISNQIPHKVAQMTRDQNNATPEMHRVPWNYHHMMQRQIAESVRRANDVSQDINSNIQSTIKQIEAVCKKASMDHDSGHDYAKDVDRILNGRKGTGGASGRAKTIMRTEACNQLSKSLIADYQARGVEQYRFVGLEADNSCEICNDMDGDIYDVDDAQEGVNLPPMHPNCQCTIKEIENEKYITADDDDESYTG